MVSINKLLLKPAAKPLLFLLALVPFGWLLYGALANTLGPNPAEHLIRSTGDWVLRFLCLTLAITPLRQWTGWQALARLRRMLGLYAFFYATLHVSTYTGLDQFFDWRAIVDDVTKRKFIFVGFAAFVLLIPLAVTSTNAAVKRMGYVRWKQLHRLAYVAPLLGVIHFTWRVKKDVSEPALYAIVLGTLLLIRVVTYARSRLSTSVAT